MSGFTHHPTDHSNKSGLFNNDQGYFRNIGTLQITQAPLLQLAYLSNVTTNEESDVTIDLNPTYLNWCDFTTLFFKSPSGGFWINPSNSSSVAVTFNDQTYQSTQNTKIPFCLSDQIIKCWSKKNSLPETAVPANYRILLNRDGFLSKGLGSIKAYSLGLSLDECISSLLNQKEIVIGDSDSSATVKFLISYKDYFKPLNTSVLVNFLFITQIPCYKNINCNNPCPPYSNDVKPCRKVFEVHDDMSVMSDNAESETTETTKTSSKDKSYFSNCDSSDYSTIQSSIKKGLDKNNEVNLDDHTILSGDSNMVSEISKIINGDHTIHSSLW